MCSHRGHRALAFQDYYDWWAANGEVAHAGKGFLIDPEDHDSHHIFFDDNINVLAELS